MRVLNAPQENGEVDAWLDQVGSEPLLIRRNDHDFAVMLSAEDYKKMQSAEWQEFDAFCARLSAEAQANGLTEEALQEILTELDADR